MVVTRLRHVHVVKRRLADGRVVEYHYAWKPRKGDPKPPRLPACPDDAEYIQAYAKAHDGRRTPTKGVFTDLISAYRASPEFRRLSAHSKRAYNTYLDALEATSWAKTLPIKALDDPKCRRLFLDWRNTMADHPRKADYAMSALKRVLSWAVEEVRIGHNHATPIGRLHHVDKSERIWLQGDIERLAAHASKELMWAVRLAAFTGLRQGDLTRLAWTHYDGESFSLRTSKRGRMVLIPATTECRGLMAQVAKRQATVLTTGRGHRPWTADGLRSSFRKACVAAGVNRTFHDLRRTACTKLLAEGHASAKVALIMGWSEESVESLRRVYVARSAVVASMLARTAENA